MNTSTLTLKMLCRTTGLAVMGLVGPFLVTQPLLALPQGGEVQAGQAQINQVNPNQLNITQQSDRSVINWQGFSVETNQMVNFQQPSASSATLNRVTGNQPSDIAGRITANGNVLLVNPNGIVFLPSAQVDVAGLMATTLDIPNLDFMNNQIRLQAILGIPPGAVENQGQITVKDGGFAALVAPRVVNSGVINARLGKVVLASGTAATLDFYGDGLLSIAVDPLLAGQVQGANGQPLSALITQSGQINADGGVVTMTARAGGAIVDNMIVSGVTQARTVSNQNGTIVLSGGDRGIVQVSGTLDASGTGVGQTGGTVRVLGNKVGLVDHAHINVSGNAGGGTVLIGGDYKGQGTVPNAERTFVSSGSKINADAIAIGNGGKVIVWADDTTRFNGNISARGGLTSGNGGFVEISGRFLDFHGNVDTLAPNGKIGTLLFDPTNIEVVAAGFDTNNLSLVDMFSDPDQGVNSTKLDVNAINNANSNVTLQATNNITFNTAINITQPGIGLTAQAGQDIKANDIKTDGGDVNLSGARITTGTIDSQTNSLNGGTVTLTANAGNITVGAINTSSTATPSNDSTSSNGGNVILTASAGNITTGTINTNSFNSSSISPDSIGSGDVTLSAPAGNIEVASISTQGNNSFAGGFGGDITITTSGLFRATGTTFQSNSQQNASISAEGGFAINDILDNGYQPFIAVTSPPAFPADETQAFSQAATGTGGTITLNINQGGSSFTVGQGSIPPNSSGTIGIITTSGNNRLTDRNGNTTAPPQFPQRTGQSGSYTSNQDLAKGITLTFNPSSVTPSGVDQTVENGNRKGTRNAACDRPNSDQNIIAVNLTRGANITTQPSPSTSTNETTTEKNICNTQARRQDKQNQPQNSNP